MPVNELECPNCNGTGITDYGSMKEEICSECDGTGKITGFNVTSPASLGTSGNSKAEEHGWDLPENPSKSQIKKAIKKLQMFIHYAGMENPMHMGEFREELAELEAKLESQEAYGEQYTTAGHDQLDPLRNPEASPPPIPEWHKNWRKEQGFEAVCPECNGSGCDTCDGTGEVPLGTRLELLEESKATELVGQGKFSWEKEYFNIMSIYWKDWNDTNRLENLQSRINNLEDKIEYDDDAIGTTEEGLWIKKLILKINEIIDWINNQ